jgi:hypothetical protein
MSEILAADLGDNWFRHFQGHVTEFILAGLGNRIVLLFFQGYVPEFILSGLGNRIVLLFSRICSRIYFGWSR